MSRIKRVTLGRAIQSKGYTVVSLRTDFVVDQEIMASANKEKAAWNAIAAVRKLDDFTLGLVFDRDVDFELARDKAQKFASSWQLLLNPTGRPCAPNSAFSRRSMNADSRAEATVWRQ